MSHSIRPCLVFPERAEEAVKFYVSLFPNSRITTMTRAEVGAGPVSKGQLINASFELDGREFSALDGGPTFQFSEGFSIMVACRDQHDVDRYWSALTADGGEEGPCGWLKDRFGVSWQIVPERLGEMLGNPAGGDSEAAMHAMLQMKKLDIAALEKAYRGSRVG